MKTGRRTIAEMDELFSRLKSLRREIRAVRSMRRDKTCKLPPESLAHREWSLWCQVESTAHCLGADARRFAEEIQR